MNSWCAIAPLHKDATKVSFKIFKLNDFKKKRHLKNLLTYF